MEKSADAFRTISEVAEDLVLPQHVLRFWETKFPQIRPLKRAGGRRYYRPADVILLRSIRQLLYDEGYTIKGVQRLLKEQGARGLRVGEPGLVPAFDGDDDAPAHEASGVYEDANVADVELVSRAVPQALTPARDRDGLREALACVEECERILQALRRRIG